MSSFHRYDISVTPFYGIDMLILLFSFSLFADEIPSIDAPPPIVNGNETGRFLQTGALMYSFEDYGADVFCSGTLVHEKWVLTAAHCIDALDEYAGYGAEMFFVLGTDLYSQEGIESYDTITFWKMHPDYNAQQLQHDIGVLELETGFPDLEPIAMSTKTPDWYDQEIIYVGWGITDDNRSDSGKKRMASITFNDYDEQFVYSLDQQGEKNLCSGDSGGSALRIQPDGTYALVGVNSFVYGVYQNAACDGGGSGATRVDSNLEWIRGYVPEPESRSFEIADAPMMGCSTMRKPSTALSIFAMLLGVVGLRRRR